MIRHRLIVLAFCTIGLMQAEAAVLIIGDDDVLASIDSPLADTKSKLKATGRLGGDIDVFDAALDTPSLELLQKYDAVLLGYSWTFADSMTLGDNLADYVDGGGGVVVTHSYAVPEGRWAFEGYFPILPRGVIGIPPTIGTVYHPAHPVMGDVVAASTGFHWPGYRPDPSAIVIADWFDNFGRVHVLAAELDIFPGRVTSLNLVAYSTDANENTGWTGDADTLMANALNYVSNVVETPAVVAALDIKPGACPNRLNPKSKGKLPVALLGTDTFNVWDVDPTTIELARADGVGGSVSPFGLHTAAEDVATPFDGEPCDCSEDLGDGMVDLTMKFSMTEIVETLELDDMESGTPVELVIRGNLFDGTPFEASDCIERVPSKKRR